MRLIEVRCPSCNATVKVQPDSSNVKCTYCRSELYIDDEASQADRFFHTATSAFSRRDSRISSPTITDQFLSVSEPQTQWDRGDLPPMMRFLT